METFKEQFAVSKIGSVDADNAVIRGVKLIGQRSLNNRVYPESCLRDSVELYNKARVYINHSKPGEETSRDTRECIGWTENCYYDNKAGGIIGDVHLYKNHQSTGLILEKAQNTPDLFGMSHVANGNSKTDPITGESVIESIEEVISVDIVDFPATNKTLFESSKTGTKKMPRAKTKSLKQVILEGPKGNKLRKLLFEMTDSGKIDEEMPVDVSDGEGGELSPEDSIKSGIRAAIAQALDSATPDQMRSILDTLGISSDIAEMTGTAEEPEQESEDEEAEEKAAESRQQNSRLMAENLLLKAGVDVTSTIVEMVAGLPASQRESAVKELKSRQKQEQEPNFNSKPSPPKHSSNESTATYTEARKNGNPFVPKQGA